MSEAYSTPLFEQPPKTINFAAISVAAALEAYYRSMLNAYLNAAIASAGADPAKTAAKEGPRPPRFSTTITANAAATLTKRVTAKLPQPKAVPVAELFPNMHVQMPTRVLYINGFKWTRQYVKERPPCCCPVDTTPAPPLLLLLVTNPPRPLPGTWPSRWRSPWPRPRPKARPACGNTALCSWSRRSCRASS